MQTHRILMVVSSSERCGNMPEPTGFWLEEVAAPYYAFTDAKCEVTVASPKGGAAPVDMRSQEESAQTASTRRFEADSKAQHVLAHTLKLSAIDADDYDAVFFAGGHGTMDDFSTDPSVKHTVEAFWNAGKPVAAVCHGPAALTQAMKPQGGPLIEGHRFTCFSDSEEAAIGLDRHVPFLLETRLTSQGGKPTNAADFQAHCVVDGQLITGQNPASSIPVAEAMIHQLRRRDDTRQAA